MTDTDPYAEPGDRLIDLLERWASGCAAGREPVPEELTTDPALRAELRRAIQAARRLRGGLSADTPADAAAPDSPPLPPAPPGYRLVRELARGGMGAVYAARDERLGRDVAVKVLQERFGPASDLARRFLEEARVTAQLQHPGIPPVHECGTLPDGRPFLAMKLVKGRTLADLLRERPEPGHERGRFVAVFEQVCQAVGYAHSKGVIHRDLKPGNVMVGAFGEVQVMDWGLTKLVRGTGRPAGSAAPPRSESVIELDRTPDQDTRAGSMLGTPPFMPPEQARGEVDALDARADVFGLGGVLCSVLTGSPPYTGSDADVRAKARLGAVGEAHARLDASGADPELVALCKRCLSPAAADRPADGGEVAALVAGLRAAADERARQAETDRRAAEVRAAEFRTRKRLRSRLLGALAAVFAVGAGASGWQAIRATDAEGKTARQLVMTREAEEKARLEAANAKTAEGNAKESEADTRAFSDYLVHSVLAAPRPTGVLDGIGVDVKMSETLLKAEADVGKVLADRPRVEATARHAIGLTWQSLGRYDRAESNLSRAVELRRRLLGPAAEETLTSCNYLGLAYLHQGKHADAEKCLLEALDGRRRALGTGHDKTLESINNMGGLYEVQGRYEEAARMYEEALTGQRQVLGEDHPDTLRSANNLAMMYRAQRRYAAAEPLIERALAGRRKVLGSEHPDTLTSMNNLGFLLFETRRLDSAEPVLTEALVGRQKLLGVKHPGTLQSVNNLALLAQARGRHADAEPLLTEALAGRRETLGPSHPDTLQSVNNLASLYYEMSKYADAEPLFREVVAGYRRLHGPSHPSTLIVTNNLALSYYELGQFGRSIPHFRDALRGLTARPEMAPSATVCQLGLGLALLGNKDYSEAEPHLLAAYGNLKKAEGTLTPRLRGRMRQVTQGLVSLYTVTNQPGTAAEWQARLAALPREIAPVPRTRAGGLAPSS